MHEDNAELARSILACADSADIAVDGFPTVGADDDLGFRDQDGTPRFSCRTWSMMAHAGREGSRALLTLTSGLGPDDGPDREVSLTLTGRLADGGLESCHCCGEQRRDVALDERLGAHRLLGGHVVLDDGTQHGEAPFLLHATPSR